MRRVLIPMLLMCLVACRTSLFENIDEAQANQIIAVLSVHGIQADKQRNADKTWNVSVESDDVVAATELTREYALPHGSHTNLGELFSRQGLISNPEENQVRYVYGLTQELSETLEKIDGVLVARVHVVQPERDPLMRPVSAPSASVMIRYRSDYNLDAMKEKIRGLVAGGVEGLTTDHVYVTLIPVTPMVEKGDTCGDDFFCSAGIDGMPRDSSKMLMVLGLMVLGLLALAWLWDRGPRRVLANLRRRASQRQAAARAPVVPPAKSVSGEDAS